MFDVDCIQGLAVRGVPLASEALSLGELLGGHLGGDEVAVPHPLAPVLARRLSDGEVEPHVRFDVVLRDASTVLVPDPELTCAKASPWSAASRYHRAASASSCGTP